MLKAILSAMAVIAVLGLGGYFLYQQAIGQPSAPQENQPSPTHEQPHNNSGVEVEVGISLPATHEVVYTNTGYASAQLTIKAGDTVVFKNESSGNMWTASATHPTHMAYGGMSLQDHCPDADNNDFDQCAAGPNGTSWSFIFNKTGEWGYHNHANIKHFGKIIIE